MENPLYSYDHTTILAVVAVVLSSVCLLVIVGLLMFRYVGGISADLDLFLPFFFLLGHLSLHLA